MIGLVGTFIVELVEIFSSYSLAFCFNAVAMTIFLILSSRVLDFQIINKGILQVIGVEIGKGLDLPL